jgi:hypothetical protein
MIAYLRKDLFVLNGYFLLKAPAAIAAQNNGEGFSQALGQS